MQKHQNVSTHLCSFVLFRVVSWNVSDFVRGKNFTRLLSVAEVLESFSRVAATLVDDEINASGVCVQVLRVRQNVEMLAVSAVPRHCKFSVATLLTGVTSWTTPWTISQAESSELCFATSSALS